MGIFNQSSSPLSTLIPQSSTEVLPDYSSAFQSTWQPQINNLQFQTGLNLQSSSNPVTAATGNYMINQSIGLNKPTQQGSSSPFNWDQGFQAMSTIGSKIGGQAGQMVSGLGNIGTNVRRIQEGIKNKYSNVKNRGIWGAVGAASDLVGSFMPQKTEYDGAKGDITQTMDSVYDGISDAAMSFGPIGQMVGNIMKGGALLGKGMNALGGGTDAMTTTDAILGSSFLNLTPLGLVNGFGGRKADTITKDNEAFAQVGSSYTGSESSVNEALQKSGKKYGLLSSGARKGANEEIAEAKRQQNTISDIANNALDRFNIQSSMSAINGNRRDFLMRGGYDQASIRVGRRGMSIELLNKAKNILKTHKENTQPIVNDLVFEYYTPKHQNGGSIINPISETVINLVNPLDVPEFQNGGSINVIPDGALHARKHNMDLKGITKKGIPVVSEKDNGKIEQQAEIEKEEVIFRLEVTQKLEELEKKYYSEEASQKEKDEYALEAGKLMVKELLHNTKDNAGLL